MSGAISGNGCPAYRCAHAGYSLSRWSVRLRSRGMMRPSLVNHSPQITRAQAIPRGTQRDPQTRARAIPRGTQETPGARCTRSPCATGSKHTVVTTGSPKTPGVSCAMVLTAYGALFPATNSSCHRHRRIDGVVAPGWARNTSAGLAPATGAGTTRFCRPQRPRPIRDWPCAADRISVEALKRRSSTRRRNAHGLSRNGKSALQRLARRRCRVHRIPSQRS